jgi:hypothetical protein
MKDVAASVGVTLRDAPCNSDADIEAVIAALSHEGRGGLLPIAEIFKQMPVHCLSSIRFQPWCFHRK